MYEYRNRYYGCLMDDDTYRLNTMSKYCFENNLNDIDYPYNYE